MYIPSNSLQTVCLLRVICLAVRYTFPMNHFFSTSFFAHAAEEYTSVLYTVCYCRSYHMSCCCRYTFPMNHSCCVLFTSLFAYAAEEV